MLYIALTVGRGPALTAVAATEETANVFYTGRERFARYIRKQPVYRPERSLRVVEVARFPFSGSVAANVNPAASAVQKLQTRFPDEGDVRLVGECSDYVHGKGMAELLPRLRAAIFGTVYSAALEVVPTDLPRPTAEGWRMKVARRDVVSALSKRSGEGALLIDVRGSLAKELATQLSDLTQRPQRSADEAAPEEDLALGVALVCYAQENRPRPGGVGEITFPKDIDPKAPRSPEV